MTVVAGWFVTRCWAAFNIALRRRTGTRLGGTVHALILAARCWRANARPHNFIKKTRAPKRRPPLPFNANENVVEEIAHVGHSTINTATPHLRPHAAGRLQRRTARFSATSTENRRNSTTEDERKIPHDVDAARMLRESEHDTAQYSRAGWSDYSTELTRRSPTSCAPHDGHI